MKLLAGLRAVDPGAKLKDRQVERDEDDRDDNAHEDQKRRLNQRENACKRRIDVFLEKTGYRIQHGRQRTGRLADFDHFDSEFRKDARAFERCAQALPFAYLRHRREDRI